MPKNIIIAGSICIIIALTVILIRDNTSDGINIANTSDEFIVADHVLTSYLGSENKLKIPDNLGILEIGEACFRDNLEISHITIPYGTRKINDSAFADCHNLKSIDFPETLLAIGDSAFLDCGFESLTLPNNITFMGGGAFAFCHSLSNITLPDNLYLISDMLFLETNLSELIIPDKVLTIGARIFNDGGFATDIKSITIPSNVKYIAPDAFIFCPNIIIKGNQNSYAEQYAKEAQTGPKEYGLPFQIISE